MSHAFPGRGAVIAWHLPWNLGMSGLFVVLVICACPASND